MSSSSPYEPDEDEDASDDSNAQIAPRTQSPSNQASSSPRIQDLRLSSEPAERDGSNTAAKPPRGPSIQPYARVSSSRGRYRARAYERLLMSLTKQSVERYSGMLGKAVEDTALTSTDEKEKDYDASQIGVIRWDGREKAVFFESLARKGRDGVKEIAGAIGSKSELEVHDYMRILRADPAWMNLRDTHGRNYTLGDVPAAAEISDDCCSALDDYAELLTLQEQYSDDIGGKKKHLNLWIIDRKSAVDIDDKIEAKDNQNTSFSSVFLAASLLHTQQFAIMSERLFMNSSGPKWQDNWRHLGFQDENPSMTADAFADFYAVVVNLTRRVMQAALFFAMSRRRNMRETGYSKANVVRPRDVKAALEMLGIKRRSPEYWIGLPRRCYLDVADIRNVKDHAPKYLDYDEVEDILTRKSRYIPAAERGNKQDQHAQSAESDADMSEVDDQSVASSTSQPNSPASQRQSPGSPDPDDEPTADMEDEYAEEVDHEGGNLEELRLWKLMDRPLPSTLDIPVKSEDEEGPSRARGAYKTREDCFDWRDRTLYRSEWEEHGAGIFDIYESMSEARRKRRRIEVDQSAERISVSASEEDEEDPDTEMEMEFQNEMPVYETGDVETDPAREQEAELLYQRLEEDSKDDQQRATVERKEESPEAEEAEDTEDETRPAPETIPSDSEVSYEPDSTSE